ncbi:MAG: pilus assembly protein [Anaerolineales bacterium]|nr:pilus assembly protein [Anaerolineales bacterium]
MKRKTQHHTREQGQSLVELAVSLVIILYLLAGAIDLGRAFFTYSALRDAAQEGAAYGSVYPDDVDEIIKRTVFAANPSGDWDFNTNLNLPRLFHQGEIDVNVQIIGAACLGNTIQVTATYTQFPTGMLAMVLGTPTIPIRATINDTILQPTCGG